jgi:hypothetical protein
MHGLVAGRCCSIDEVLLRSNRATPAVALASQSCAPCLQGQGLALHVLPAGLQVNGATFNPPFDEADARQEDNDDLNPSQGPSGDAPNWRGNRDPGHRHFWRWFE